MSLIARVRWIGIVESISYVALLGIGSTLKHFAGKPEPVKYLGLTHGFLFVLYFFAVFHAGARLAWPKSRTVKLVCAGLVPFGPLFFDGWLRRQETDKT